MTRTVPVLFRTKSRRPDLRLSVKVITNCRVPGKGNPVQLHLGYLSPRYDWEEVPQGQREKLLTNLRKKWLVLFRNEEVDIDWDDAGGKWFQLRSRLRVEAVAVMKHGSDAGMHGEDRTSAVMAAKTATSVRARRNASMTMIEHDEDEDGGIYGEANDCTSGELELDETGLNARRRARSPA